MSQKTFSLYDFISLVICYSDRKLTNTHQKCDEMRYKPSVDIHYFFNYPIPLTPKSSSLAQMSLTKESQNNTHHFLIFPGSQRPLAFEPILAKQSFRELVRKVFLPMKVCSSKRFIFHEMMSSLTVMHKLQLYSYSQEAK